MQSIGEYLIDQENTEIGFRYLKILSISQIRPVTQKKIWKNIPKLKYFLFSECFLENDEYCIETI
jgi:hypothetical protein